MIKGLEMGRWSWTVQVGLKSYHKYPYERQWEITPRRGPCDLHVTVESEIGVTTGKGMPAVTRSWKREGTDSPLGAPVGIRPCQHFDFSPMKLISNFWPPELWKSIFLFLLSHLVMIICYSSHEKLYYLRASCSSAYALILTHKTHVDFSHPEL